MRKYESPLNCLANLGANRLEIIPPLLLQIGSADGALADAEICLFQMKIHGLSIVSFVLGV